MIEMSASVSDRCGSDEPCDVGVELFDHFVRLGIEIANTMSLVANNDSKYPRPSVVVLLATHFKGR